MNPSGYYGRSRGYSRTSYAAADKGDPGCPVSGALTKEILSLRKGAGVMGRDR